MTIVKAYTFCSEAFSICSIASTAALRWTSNLGSIKTFLWKKSDPGKLKKHTAPNHLRAEPYENILVSSTYILRIPEGQESSTEKTDVYKRENIIKKMNKFLAFMILIINDYFLLFF